MAARTSAFSTYKVYLMAYDGSAFKRLINIKDFPDLGGQPEQLETTTLSNQMNTYTPGIQSFDSLTFTCNYTSANYSKVATYCTPSNNYSYAVFIGDDTTGDDGTFYFNATGNVFVSGGGVNEVVEMTITLSPSTDITTTAPGTLDGAAFTPATDSDS
ncbi:MAG: hypothetical protein J6S85_02560 [Methanobrevibacter sp.]|nr:hypothetical protein [Methanobrevibacter sp.]